jgi:glycerol-3-phosphate acyltransferase PlsY
MLFWSQHQTLAALFAVLSAMLWIMHRANIKRLRDGTEGKIGKKG